jgi:lysozyme family protein
MATVAFTSSLRDEYQELFDSCHVRPERATEVNGLVKKVGQNRERYDGVGAPLGIPWYFVGVIHGMEASFDFTRHLHNGDPLTARTVQEPPNRPASGQPPFSWEESATDALRLKKLEKITDWDLPRTLYQLEAYNGFGYRLRHPEVLTPYLWSFSDHYTQGKYIADGTFSPTAVSKQCGAAVLLRRMAELAVIEFRPDGTPMTDVADHGGASNTLFDEFGPLVQFSTKKKSTEVENLQRLLNTFPGIFVKVDGVPGEKTSDAFKKVTGHFLVGDPRAEE